MLNPAHVWRIISSISSCDNSHCITLMVENNFKDVRDLRHVLELEDDLFFLHKLIYGRDNELRGVQSSGVNGQGTSKGFNLPYIYIFMQFATKI